MLIYEKRAAPEFPISPASPLLNHRLFRKAQLQGKSEFAQRRVRLVRKPANEDITP
jgi:hypothetical protein